VFIDVKERNHIMKKLISLLMAAVLLLAFAGCGAEPETDNGPSVEGTWLCSEEEGGYGYAFDALQTNDDGGKSGQAYMRPAPVIDYGIFYSYSFVSETEIEIVSYAPTGDGTAAEPTSYDTLRLEEQDGQRVLVSTVTEMKYYFQEDAE
jgi:hypothetical protein